MVELLEEEVLNAGVRELVNIKEAAYEADEELVLVTTVNKGLVVMEERVSVAETEILKMRLQGIGMDMKLCSCS